MSDPTPPAPKKLEYLGVAERTVAGMSKQRDALQAENDALTVKLAAAEAERDTWRDEGRAARENELVACEQRNAAEAENAALRRELAAAEAVIEAVEAHLADDLDLERATKLDAALATYRDTLSQEEPRDG